MSEYKSKKNKRNLSDIESIYKDYDSRFQKGGSGFGRIIISILFFILMIFLTAAAGYYIFHEKDTGEELKLDDVVFEIKGSDSAISGEEIFYIVKYKNNSGVDMDDFEISFNYPEKFMLGMTEPKFLEEKNSLPQSAKWIFDKIGKGEEGEIKIRGILVGNIGDVKEFTANLKYNPVNTEAHFIKRSSLTAEVKDRYLGLSVEGGEKFIEGEKNKLFVKYNNKSATSLRDIKLIAYFPKEAELFLAGSASSTALNGENGMKKYEMEIDELAGKSEKELEMDILVDSNEYSAATLKFQIGYLNNEGEFFLQEEENRAVDILKGSLEANLIINGKKDEIFANLGNILNYSLILKNSGNIVLGDIKPRIIIDDSEQLLNWNSAKSQGGKVLDGEIFWDKENFSELEKLNEGEEIEFSFSIILNDSAENIIEGAILSWAEIIVGKTGNMEEEKKFKSNLIGIKLNTDLALENELRYFSENGDSIGSGPIPPKISERTNYKIFLRLTNNINETRDVKVSVKLADKADWAGKISLDSGELYYDQETRQVIWTIPKLPKKLVDKMSGVFEISLEPKEEDAGRSVILVEDILLEGFDGKTGVKLERSYPFITTDDEESGGRGVVGN